MQSTITMSWGFVWSLNTVLVFLKGTGHHCEASVSSSMALNTSGLHVSVFFPAFYPILLPWTMSKALTSALMSFTRKASHLFMQSVCTRQLTKQVWRLMCNLWTLREILHMTWGFWRACCSGRISRPIFFWKFRGRHQCIQFLWDV